MNFPVALIATVITCHSIPCFAERQLEAPIGSGRIISTHQLANRQNAMQSQSSGTASPNRRRSLNKRRERKALEVDSTTDTSSSNPSAGIDVDGGTYDCTSAPTTDNPCSNIEGYNILPLWPNCQHYMLCDQREFSLLFTCGEGESFDHRVQRCVSDDLVYCPCSNDGGGSSNTQQHFSEEKTATDTTTQSSNNPTVKATRTSGFQTGDNGAYYDCSTAALPTDNPCENIVGYNLLPLWPNCQQYIECDEEKLLFEFTCNEGMAFDHRLQKCVSETLVDCPCSSSTDKSYSKPDNNENASAVVKPRSHSDTGKKEGSSHTSTTTDGSIKHIRDTWDPKTAKVTHFSKSSKLAKTSSTKSTKSSSKSRKSGKVSKSLAPLAKSGKSSKSLAPLTKSGKSSKSQAPVNKPPTTTPPPSSPRPTKKQTSNPTPTLEACPKVYDVSIEYKENDKVSLTMNTPGNSEITHYSRCKPASPKVTCGDIWSDDWELIGVCDPSISLPVTQRPSTVPPDSVPRRTTSPTSASAPLTTKRPSSDPPTSMSPTTNSPSVRPTSTPVTDSPSVPPTLVLLTNSPSLQPTSAPMTNSPSVQPTPTPVTNSPSDQPASTPVTNSPSDQPTPTPVTNSPSDKPTPTPVTNSPSDQPASTPVTNSPSDKPTPTPVTDSPSDKPTSTPVTNSPMNMPVATTVPPSAATTVPRGCPPAYDATTEYTTGDIISGPDPENPTAYNAYSCDPSDEFPTCSRDNDNNILNQAWKFLGICYVGSTDTTSPTPAPTERLTTRPGCPPVYDVTSEYVEGDIVSSLDPENPRAVNAYMCVPSDKFPSCNGNDNDDNDTLNQAWAFLGICYAGGSSTRTPSEALTQFPSPPPAPVGDSSCISPTASSENFESGIFPEPPWSTGGDGNWTIDEGDAYEGSYSIKSPDLSGATSFPAVSNATISTCESFAGGTLELGVRASVLPPSDIFVIFVDGEKKIQMIDAKDWRSVTVDVPPGTHVIDFSYQYNVFNINPVPPSPPGIEGVVYIDDVLLVAPTDTSSSLFIKLEHTEEMLSSDAEVILSSDLDAQTNEGTSSREPFQWRYLYFPLAVFCVVALGTTAFEFAASRWES